MTTALTPLSPSQVHLDDGFWRDRCETNRLVTLPAEFQQLQKSGGLDAYRWDWPSHKHPPIRSTMGDLPKWIEGAAHALASDADSSLMSKASNAIERLLRGQKIDGYLYSNQISLDERFTNLRGWHELYDMGHTIESSVAWMDATGDDRFLRAMCRSADLIDSCFGPGSGQKRGYDGHPEIELALMKLHRATGEDRYLQLASFFVEERGCEPYYFDVEARARGEEPNEQRHYAWRGRDPYTYYQSHLPLRQQKEAIGHAVRALYLYAGMVDVATATNDRQLLATCRRLFRSVTRKRMYITGGIGSEMEGEAITFDYDLPNETAYAETCASIALVFFAHRLLQTDADGEYADVIERAMFNGILGGVSLGGDSFYYANPLAVHPRASEGAADFLSATRVQWFTCACCPPNLARFIPQIPGYLYSTGPRELLVHQYASNRAEFTVDTCDVAIKQETAYPWDGRISITINPSTVQKWRLALRIPSWCKRARLKVNDKALALGDRVVKGYAVIERRWERGDRVELTLEMPVQRIEAHPGIRGTVGRIALQRGPLVYCIEGADNGSDLGDIAVPADSELAVSDLRGALRGMKGIVVKGRRSRVEQWKGTLYAPRSRSSRATRAIDVRAVPFFARANRKPGEMLVWLREH